MHFCATFCHYVHGGFPVKYELLDLLEFKLRTLKTGFTVLTIQFWFICCVLDRSQDEFVVSDENPDESEEDPPSNDDSDTDFCSRRLRRHPSRPMRQSRRLRRKTPKKKYSDDDEEEESEENSRDSGKNNLYTHHINLINSCELWSLRILKLHLIWI